MQLHLVPPHPTAYSRSLASPCHFCLLAPSFAPSIVSFSNRWSFKSPLSALFSTTSPSCKCEAKDGKKTEAWCTHLQIPLIMPRQTDRHAYRWDKYAHTYTQTGTETQWTMQTAWHKLGHAHTSAETQTHRYGEKKPKLNWICLWTKSTFAPASWLQLWRHQIRLPVTQWPLQLV